MIGRGTIDFAGGLEYNEHRQKDRVIVRIPANAPRAATPGAFFLLYGANKPRLVTGNLISVQPFANVVGSYTCCDRNQKRQSKFHQNTPLPATSIGAVTRLLWLVNGHLSTRNDRNRPSFSVKAFRLTAPRRPSNKQETASAVRKIRRRSGFFQSIFTVYALT